MGSIQFIGGTSQMKSKKTVSNPSNRQWKQAENWARGILVLAGVVVIVVWTVAAAARSFVRVHQTGYVSSATQRAYLMTSSASAGTSFSVLNSSGSPVFSAAIGADQGKWGTFGHVYALDFDAVTTAGTYTISVSGAITAVSVSFRIDSGANLYSTPLANTLFFYQNERDGANFIATPLRTAPAT